MRHEIWGPRIIVKRDEESSIGRGCILYGAHFREGVSHIPRLICACAPLKCQIVYLTEGWRDIRDSRDLHETLCAFDATLEMPMGMRATESEYEQTAQRLRIALGPGYDVIPHGEGMGLHLHIEWDHRKEA